MRLILIPLTILIILSIFSILGLGQELNTTVYVAGVSGAYGSEPLIYDISGTAIAQVLENGTIKAIYENYGIINNIEPLSGGPAAGAAVLINSTAPYSWLLYWDNAQVHQILYTDLENLVVHGPQQVDTAKNYVLGGSAGMFGLIGVLMVIAIGVGVRVLGIGISEESVSTILKGTGWTSIWLVFTALSYPLVFGTGEILLFILWFVLTVVFTLGCINSFGHPGND